MLILGIIILSTLSCLGLMIAIIRSETQKNKEMQRYNDNLDKFMRDQEELIRNLNETKKSKN